MKTLHFVAGLPRAGSTLLEAILRQNPQFYASVQSPLFDVFRAALQALSNSDSSLFVGDTQRERVLHAIPEAFYCHVPGEQVVFDSHRGWCTLLPAIATVSPRSRVICCLRNPAWVLDSIERIVQANALRTSRIFGYETGNVYTRHDTLTAKQLLGPALRAVRQAWFSEYADRLIAIPYESLVERPRQVVEKLYQLLGEEPFPHDFKNIDYAETEFDDRIGLPGMHSVVGPIAKRSRDTILPPEIFRQHDSEFWVNGENPRKVIVL